MEKDAYLDSLKIVYRLNACLHYALEPESDESVQEFKRTGKLSVGYSALLGLAYDYAAKLNEEIIFIRDQTNDMSMIDNNQPSLSSIIRTRLRPYRGPWSPITLECYNGLATSTTKMLNETAEFSLRDRIVAVQRTLHRVYLQTPQLTRS